MMDTKQLAKVIDERAATMLDSPPYDGVEAKEKLDNAMLLFVLVKILNGTPIERAFGAPGDWGYQHPIGKALIAALRESANGTCP